MTLMTLWSDVVVFWFCSYETVAADSCDSASAAEALKMHAQHPYLTARPEWVCWQVRQLQQTAPLPASYTTSNVQHTLASYRTNHNAPPSSFVNGGGAFAFASASATSVMMLFAQANCSEL